MKLIRKPAKHTARAFKKRASKTFRINKTQVRRGGIRL